MKSTVNAPRIRTYIPDTSELNREIEVLRKECPDGDWKQISARLLAKNKTWNVTERKITKLVKRSSNNTDDQSRVSSSSSFRRFFSKSTNSDASSKASKGSLRRFFNKTKKPEKQVLFGDKSRQTNADNSSVASKGSVSSLLSNSSKKADAKKLSEDAESSSLLPPLKQCESDEEEPDFPEEKDAMPTVDENSICTSNIKDETDGNDEATVENVKRVDESVQCAEDIVSPEVKDIEKEVMTGANESVHQSTEEIVSAEVKNFEKEELANPSETISSDVLEVAAKEKEAEKEDCVDSNVGCDDDISEIDILEIGEVLQTYESVDRKSELYSLKELNGVKSDLVDASAPESGETDSEDLKSTHEDGTYILTFNTSEDTDDDEVPPSADKKRVVVTNCSESYTEKSLLLLHDDLSRTNSDDSNEGSENLCTADVQEFLGKNNMESKVARNSSLSISLKVAAGLCLGVGLLLLPSCNTGQLG